MRLSLRPYRHGDFEEIEPRADFAAEQAALGWPLRHAPPPGRAWTLLRGETVIGCGGVAPGDDGQRHAWAYLGTLSCGEWGQALRYAGLALELAEAEADDEIQASARADSPAAIRTLERLGFDPLATSFAVGEAAYIDLGRR